MAEKTSDKPYWQDVQVVSVNKEYPRTSFMTYDNRTDALTGKFEKSNYYQLLNGTWKFFFADSYKDLPANITDPSVSTDSWNDIKVPGNWEVQGYGVAIYTNHGFTTWAKKGDKADASYDFTVTEQKATKEKASCKNAHYLEDGYLDTDGVFYLKDAQGDTQVKFNDIVIKVSEAKLYSDYIPASHILGVPTKNEKTGWEEAKCMVCGAVFACTNDEAVLTKNSIKTKDTVSYNSYAADCVYRDNDYNFAWGEQYADSYAYTWQLKAGSNGSGSSNTGKPVASPKTFDAGIAAYVGLSLLSVAGGAVVIGKKKEF